ncbi:MAG TPA: protein kinase, partial [Candidatus Nanopelagicales bacterium]|nr:protein kinase [Candidatus Nanopelagicales bacterium]
AAMRSSQTTTGVLKGKLSYMAPEQARARPVDRRADLFVIGILLWEVLVGRKMWKGLADMEIVNKIFSQEIPRIEEVREDLPEDLLRIVNRALAYDPEDRYTTAAEMRAELLGYLERVGQRVSTEETGELVARLFADRRAQLQTVIDGQIKRLRTMGGAPLLDMNGTIPPGSGRTVSSSGTTPLTPLRSEPLPNLSYPAPDASSVTRQSPAPQAEPRKNRVLFPALAGAAVSGLVALLVMRSGAPGALTSPPAPAGESAAAAAASPSTQQTASAPTGSPRTIEVRISASPASAKIYLDDVELDSNPFTGRFPADGLRHLVRVVASGRATQKEFANFEHDVTLEFDLEKRTSATVSYRPRPAADPAASDPYPTSSPAEPTAADTPQPGPTGGKPKRSLSGSDPWSGTPTGAPQPATTSTSTKPKRQLSGSDPWAN